MIVTNALRVVRRAGQIGADLLRASAGGLRSLRWLAAPPAVGPGVAILAGEPIARTGTPASYRVRVHNPSRAPRALAIAVTGRRGSEPSPVFELRWEVTVPAGESAERWVETTWQDGATLTDAPAEVFPAPAGPRPGPGWTVEARLDPPVGGSEPLRIAGRFTS